MANIISEKYQEVDYRKGGFFGYRFAKNGRTCGDKKCDYCGKWFHWDTANMERYILQRRWNERKSEVIHCNNSLCQDYHQRYLVHMNKLATSGEYRMSNFVEREKRKGVEEKTAFGLFQRLHSKGMVA